MMKSFIILIFSILSLRVYAQRQDPQFLKAEESLYDNPDRTIRLSKQILKSESSPDRIAHINLLISNAYMVKRNTDSSLYYVLKTKELVTTNIQTLTKAKILNYVAIQYQQMELYEKALETLDQSTGYTLKLPKSEYYRLYFQAFNNSVRGMIYKNLSNYDMAIEKLKLAEQQFKASKKDEMTAANISIVLYNIGYCYLDINQPDQSRAYFNESILYAEKSKQDILAAFSYKGYADYLFNIGNYKASNLVLSKAENLAKNAKDLTLKSGIYKIMADNYSELDDWDQFIVYHQRYQDLQKEKAEFEEKSLVRFAVNQEHEIKSQARSSQKFFLIFAISIVFFALLIALFLIRLLKRFKLNNQRKQIEFKNIFNNS